LDARLTIFLCKKTVVAKSKEVKAGWSDSQEWINLTESSKESQGAKRAILPVIMMMMMMTAQLEIKRKDTVT
jgi:hypothetical protein